jgi:hypothetical protein
MRRESHGNFILPRFFLPKIKKISEKYEGTNSSNIQDSDFRKVHELMESNKVFFDT